MAWWTVLIFGLGLVLFIVILIAIFQHRLVYHPRSYSGESYQLQSDAVETLSHRTSSGIQIAYLLRTSEVEPVTTVWIIFGGNAMLALEWIDFFASFNQDDVAFLLVDYPGYGDSEGHSSPDTLRESSISVFDNLVQTYLQGNQQLKVGLFGHSLGCAVALNLATSRPVDRIILSAPFTSTMDMTRLIMGRWAIPFLRHRFDNIARMREVFSGSRIPDIHIFHGAKDELIPVTMGQKIALVDERVQYHEDSSSDHNTILEICRAQMLSRMVFERNNSSIDNRRAKN